MSTVMNSSCHEHPSCFAAGLYNQYCLHGRANGGITNVGVQPNARTACLDGGQSSVRARCIAWSHKHQV